MKIKKGASLAGMDIRIRPALVTADRLWSAYGHELVITCGLDSAHSAGSLHYYGLAIDCRTNYFEPSVTKRLVQLLKYQLPKEFDVILHSTHIHIECDIFKNTEVSWKSLFSKAKNSGRQSLELQFQY